MEIDSPALARRPARRQPRSAVRCWVRSCPQASPGPPCAWKSGSGKQPPKCEPQSKRGPYEREKKKREAAPILQLSLISQRSGGGLYWERRVWEKDGFAYRSGFQSCFTPGRGHPICLLQPCQKAAPTSAWLDSAMP